MVHGQASAQGGPGKDVGVRQGILRSQDPPNAGLVFQGVPGPGRVAIVELSDAHYHSKARTLNAAATAIAKDDLASTGAHAGLADFAQRNDATVPKKFGPVEAFIDAAPIPLETPDQAEVQALTDQVARMIYAWNQAFATGSCSVKSSILSARSSSGCRTSSTR